MINAVLLHGYLSEKVLDDAGRQIVSIRSGGGMDCTIIVDSEGGDCVPAMRFVKQIGAMNMLFAVKVYNAQSAAAYITLALRYTAEMRRGSEMSFHLGRLKVGTAELSPDGQVPKEMLLSLREYNMSLEDVLQMNRIMDPKLLASLHGSGWLHLTANQCLEFGIVQRLF